MNKLEWINFFRKKCEKTLKELCSETKVKKSEEKAKIINKMIKQLRDECINNVLLDSKNKKWDNKKRLEELMLLTYASYIAMLEYRNKVWPYEYMAFSRRIGELWEPFSKLPFYYSINDLKIIDVPNFDEIQNLIKNDAIGFIKSLEIDNELKNKLLADYKIPWTMVDSGGIKLELDLHFEQKGVHYNCDFKSGFSSNEKGNTNRLLLVASIYRYIGNNERTLLFVRQREDENNHYLQTLKESNYWDVYCANDCYKKIYDFTGFDIRKWLDDNVDWSNDISKELKEHLQKYDLLKYLTW